MEVPMIALLLPLMLAQVTAPTSITVHRVSQTWSFRGDTAYNDSVTYGITWPAVSGAVSYNIRMPKASASLPIAPADFLSSYFYHQGTAPADTVTLSLATVVDSVNVKVAVRACDPTGCSAFKTSPTFYLVHVAPQVVQRPVSSTVLRAVIDQRTLFRFGIMGPGTSSWPVADSLGNSAGTFSCTWTGP